MSDYYDKAGNAIAIEAWTKLYRDAEYKRIASDKAGDTFVSTVWLGLNHAWEGPPLIFETMVFEGPLDGECDRYSTLAQAEAGHAAMLARVLAARGSES